MFVKLFGPRITRKRRVVVAEDEQRAVVEGGVLVAEVGPGGAATKMMAMTRVINLQSRMLPKMAMRPKITKCLELGNRMLPVKVARFLFLKVALFISQIKIETYYFEFVKKSMRVHT